MAEPAAVAAVSFSDLSVIHAVEHGHLADLLSAVRPSRAN